MLWLQLLLCLLFIAIAGYQLSRYADVIAEKTGLSASWIGLLLLSTATSLPELVTGISAVSLANAPDIAVGDALGSAVFNLMILVVLERQYRQGALYCHASDVHILSAALGAILIAFIGFCLLLDQVGFNFSWRHISWYSPVIVVCYVLCMTMLYRREQHDANEQRNPAAQRYLAISIKQAVFGYLIAALVIVIAGCWLPLVAKQIALHMGWQQSFVGTLLVASITSAPELAVTLSALRLGALDMAIANLLGSNLFNMVILAVDDVFYLQGPLLADVKNHHLVTISSAAMMSCVFVAGLIYRPRQGVLLRVSWIGLLLLLLYVLTVWLLFNAWV